jgi:hypothetical protein
MLSTGRENLSMVMPSKSDNTASEEFPGITNVTLLPATGECYFLDYVIDRNGSCGDNIKYMEEAGQKQNDQREFLVMLSAHRWCYSSLELLHWAL